MSEPEMSRTYEEGYLQALIDQKIWHELQSRSLKKDAPELRHVHDEIIAALTGLIAMKRERALNEAIKNDPLR